MPITSTVRKKSPSRRWNTEHGNKLIHRYWLGALFHLIRLCVRYGETNKRIYICRWHQWYTRGETAKKHYHVGRKKR